MGKILFLHAIMQVIASYGSCWGFGLCLNIPKRGLNAASITGVIGWLCYHILFILHVGKIFDNLCGALAIGISSLVFAHIKKMPVTMFTIPALMPLVPGGTAYQALRVLVLGHIIQAQILWIHVMLIAGALAVGFMLSTLLTKMYDKIINKFYR